MPVNRMTRPAKVVNFFAYDVTDASSDVAARAANDNTCPYCGGVLEPGDKASDCSGSGAWPLMPFPQGWGGSC